MGLDNVKALSIIMNWNATKILHVRLTQSRIITKFTMHGKKRCTSDIHYETKQTRHSQDNVSTESVQNVTRNSA